MISLGAGSVSRGREQISAKHENNFMQTNGEHGFTLLAFLVLISRSISIAFNGVSEYLSGDNPRDRGNDATTCFAPKI